MSGAISRVLWYEYIDKPNDSADNIQIIFLFDLIKNKYIPNNKKNWAKFDWNTPLPGKNVHGENEAIMNVIKANLRFLNINLANK